MAYRNESSWRESVINNGEENGSWQYHQLMAGSWRISREARRNEGVREMTMKKWRIVKNEGENEVTSVMEEESRYNEEK